MTPATMTPTAAPAPPGVNGLTTCNLVELLGEVPLDRICFDPMPGTATEQDLLDLHQKTGRLYELVEGILVEKAMGYPESILAAGVIYWLKAYLINNKLGAVGAPDALMRLTPGRVRMPDVSFVFYTRLPGGQVQVEQPFANLAPDIAVEVISPRNTPSEIATKLREYFRYGTRLAWVIDPRARTVEVYTSPTGPALLQQTDTLDGGTVLPGFALPLAQLFGELDPP